MQSSKTRKCLADRAVGNTPIGVWVGTVHKLTSRDLRNLLGAVSILNESLDLGRLPRRTAAAVTRVLPTDSAKFPISSVTGSYGHSGCILNFSGRSTSIIR
jgi:hypothetical protein